MLFRKLNKSQSFLEVCGSNQHYQLGEKSNKTSFDIPIISPIAKSRIDAASLLSYSIYSDHAVLITKSGMIQAIGDNTENQISGSLPKRVLKDFTKFEIKDDSGVAWVPISVVCGYSYTLYLVAHPDNGNKMQLAYSYEGSSSQFPTFLNLKKRIPLSLFGGYSNAAAIDTTGAILFVPESTSSYSDSPIEATQLPDDEKAISVACCDDFILALSSSGRVYRFDTSGTSDLTSIEDITPDDSEIVSITGTKSHAFAVDKNGAVFGLGLNSGGRLGLGEDTKSADEFVLVSAFKNNKIKLAFAGSNHSLFLTNDGKVLGCGANNVGQIPITSTSIYKDKKFFAVPIETTVVGGAAFCIAGGLTTAVFTNCIPPKIPNKEINEEDKKLKPEDENILLKEALSELTKENESLRRRIIQLESKLNNEPDILTSEEIDQLTQVKSLGHGPKSEVFEVSRTQQFALKVLEKKNEDDENEIKKILQDFKSLNCLNHPNIVKTIGIFSGNAEKNPSILVELCTNNLKEVVKNLTDVQKVTAIYEIALALKEIHAKNLIHRDLKPENILVDAKMHVKVDDFDVARIVDVEEQIKLLDDEDDSMNFMAPELLEGKKEYDNKVDVYSFGVVVFFILTGGKYPELSFEQAVNGEIPSIPSIVNDYGKDLIESCWARKPEERPSFENIIESIKNHDFELVDGIENEIKNIKSFLLI